MTQQTLDKIETSALKYWPQTSSRKGETQENDFNKVYSLENEAAAYTHYLEHNHNHQTCKEQSVRVGLQNCKSQQLPSVQK